MTEPESKKPQKKKPEPCAFVIFGATGDLAHRLTIPALYNLAASNLLPDNFCVVGVARHAMSNDELRESLMKGLHQFATRKVDDAIAKRLLECVTCIAADPKDPASFDELSKKLDALEKQRQTKGNRLFYMATPPNAFAPISRELGRTGMLKENGCWRRLVIEKPFGTDLASAKALNAELLKIAEERQLYRIDHYLGKETVQNILVLRFANGMFEPIWNRNHIDHIQITVEEKLGVGHRGSFYDSTGALRDMVPNHLFQLLALTAMEPPSRFDAGAVRSAKLEALQAIRPLSDADIAADVVRGQYGGGRVKGKMLPPYREAPGVARDSVTETYVAMRLAIDNWRWAGVPFYLRTGKALAARKTEIAIKFRSAPLALFRDMPVESLAQNLLVLRIQPDEGAALHFNAKIPGPDVRIENVRMNFKYEDYFDAAPSTGYETLIYDCMVGDPMLFQRAVDIEAGWRVVDPILAAWRDGDGNDLCSYPAGSDGPAKAQDLLAHSDRQWRPVA